MKKTIDKEKLIKFLDRKMAFADKGLKEAEENKDWGSRSWHHGFKSAMELIKYDFLNKEI